MDFSRDFIALACRKGVLRFGAFVTKAGRNSPYFFNAGLFDDGASFRELCGYYARTIRASGVSGAATVRRTRPDGLISR